MQLIKRICAIAFAAAFSLALVIPASAYNTSGSWSLYYYRSASKVSQTIRLVYSGNGYTLSADSFGGDCTAIITTIKANETTRKFTRTGTNSMTPANPGTEWLDFKISMDMSGGNTATSTGTITRK
jgi:hypothetical protein